MKALPTDHQAFRTVEAEVSDRVKRMLSINGKCSPDWYHRELGRIMWNLCGMARSDEGLRKAVAEITALREDFYRDLRVLGENDELNQSLEKAGRVADFLEFAELLCRDALHRNESCGGHFRVEYQTEDGEALRNDEDYSYVAAWQFTGVGRDPVLHTEPLSFEYVHPTQRSYK